MRRPLSAAVALVLALIAVAPVGVARAAEYEMSTQVQYVVDPAVGTIAVTVAVTFTNTTPNPAGQVSGFDHVDLAIHDGASGVSADDAKGALTVALESRDGVQIASVKTRARVRYNRSVSFTLSYQLADASAPDVHVRPEVVKFAAFGIGTSSHVTVDLPAGYDVRADGDPMVTSSQEGLLRLTSGPIAEPDRWLALVTASRPTDYATHSASVALASGTVDLQVRSWVGDQAWGEQTLAMLVGALPSLEQAIGLPYPRVGPLVVTEAVGREGSVGEIPSSNGEILVGFDQPPFTLLHQAAHIWIDEALAADRWIREGLASHCAAQVAAGLGASLPYDPAARAGELVADALPLADWGVTAPGAAADAYGYAASWAFIDRIATAVGEAHLTDALGRVVAGVSAYDPIEPDPAAPAGHGFAPIDSRRLLDQLAAASGTDLADRFGVVVFGPQVGVELAQRASARADYARVTATAGDWGAPDPIRGAMAAWRFDDARALIAEAEAWLVERDSLIARIATAGLSTPEQLRARFAAEGGGPGAETELSAEQAVVDPYRALQVRAIASRGLLDTIGLFAADDPHRLLAEAATKFGAGDLRTAAEALDGVQLQLDRAPTNGLVRLASAAVLLAVIGLFMGRTSRRRDGSHYTAGT